MPCQKFFPGPPHIRTEDGKGKEGGSFVPNPKSWLGSGFYFCTVLYTPLPYNPSKKMKNPSFIQTYHSLPHPPHFPYSSHYPIPSLGEDGIEGDKPSFLASSNKNSKIPLYIPCLYFKNPSILNWDAHSFHSPMHSNEIFPKPCIMPLFPTIHPYYIIIYILLCFYKENLFLFLIMAYVIQKASYYSF